MQSKGLFMFKSVEKRNGGSFKNDKGETIEFSASYVIKADDLTGKSISERKFKFPVNNTTLYNKLEQFDAYERVNLTFDVEIFNNTCRLVPVDVELAE